jgi:hypothetical protein
MSETMKELSDDLLLENQRQGNAAAYNILLNGTTIRCTDMP